MHLDRSHAQFDQTRWSLIERARDTDPTIRAEALGKVVERCMPPVYAYLRRSGKNREEASDLTQGFFAEKVLGPRFFDSVHPSKGHLRTLILAALRNYLTDRSRRRDAERRAIERGLLEGAIARLHAEEMFLESSRAGSADEVFVERWSVGLLREAIHQCEKHFERTGKRRHWAAFRVRVLEPAIATVDPPSLEDVARSLGFPKPADAGSAVAVVKKQLRMILSQLDAEDGALAARGYP